MLYILEAVKVSIRGRRYEQDRPFHHGTRRNTLATYIYMCVGDTYLPKKLGVTF